MSRDFSRKKFLINYHLRRNVHQFKILLLPAPKVSKSLKTFIHKQTVYKGIYVLLIMDKVRVKNDENMKK